MNLAGFLLLAYVACVAWACLTSEFKEFNEQDDDDSDNPYDGSNGI